MKIEVKVTGLKELQIKFKRMGVESKGLISTIIKKIAFKIEGESAKESPVKTGRLRRSIFSKVESPVLVVITAPVEYATVVHEGRQKARTIMTKRGRRRLPVLAGNPFFRRGIGNAKPFGGIIKKETKRFFT